MTGTAPPHEGDHDESVHDLDDVDRQILADLATDARNTSCPDIANKVDVTPATIRNRIENLVSNDVIEAHRSEINYRQLGFLKVLFICSVNSGRFGELTVACHRIRLIPSTWRLYSFQFACNPMNFVSHGFCSRAKP
ncbi:putative transcriptional regulator, AsnC family protein [Natrinema pellirubrum DSM 15624]|uniref:Putative transcriptional regulator, AsnC family protein n=1 Tax=Natrinema pellirubrum (strain DSM 15624 / CIP 106293 / JCM 10476 / NCIMB 786 / 157) TaxID=797303 RepID=L0JKE1_NATP1|nr:AsnC family transcriptional regulator [Natrinema pellirubrum]AGB31744.1 hypothetical protein Natpe_1881 [Natrinema pellirubrum DSM 15624]ELY72778.1 putative transcriptional regulator, AsnC family protein [Natrinema pellirubrum DSM 15624]